MGHGAAVGDGSHSARTPTALFSSATLRVIEPLPWCAFDRELSTQEGVSDSVHTVPVVTASRRERALLGKGDSGPGVKDSRQLL